VKYKNFTDGEIPVRLQHARTAVGG